MISIANLNCDLSPLKLNRSGEDGVCFTCTQGVMCEAADVYQHQPYACDLVSLVFPGKMFRWKFKMTVVNLACLMLSGLILNCPERKKDSFGS